MLYRIGTEHEKFGFDVETLRPITYDQISAILNGLSERFEWDKIMEENHVIGLKQVLCLERKMIYMVFTESIVNSVTTYLYGCRESKTFH